MGKTTKNTNVFPPNFFFEFFCFGTHDPDHGFTRLVSTLVTLFRQSLSVEKFVSVHSKSVELATIVIVNSATTSEDGQRWYR